jgi:hypothetical protein
MDYLVFRELVQRTTPIGCVLDNPGSGTTTILGYDGDFLKYRRGRSPFKAPLRVFWEVVNRFAGKRLKSSELQKVAPEVFDSRSPHFGHSCNCTVLYLLLHRAGIVERIGGKGVRGNPFFVEIPRELPPFSRR